MPTEADTCRKFVLPKLYAAGWDDDQIREQRTFTDGRILVAGTKVWRRPKKRQAVPAPSFTGQSDSSPAQVRDCLIDFKQVALQAGKPDADPFDLLCHLAFNAPVLTRRQRADRVKKKQTAFFKTLAPEARDILTELLEKYATDGELQFTLPDVLKVPPISNHGNVNEIITKFGGEDELREAVNKLQALMYAA